MTRTDVPVGHGRPSKALIPASACFEPSVARRTRMPMIFACKLQATEARARHGSGALATHARLAATKSSWSRYCLEPTRREPGAAAGRPCARKDHDAHSARNGRVFRFRAGLARTADPPLAEGFSGASALGCADCILVDSRSGHRCASLRSSIRDDDQRSAKNRRSHSGCPWPHWPSGRGHEPTW
jgi:hypothetical protein